MRFRLKILQSVLLVILTFGFYQAETSEVQELIDEYLHPSKYYLAVAAIFQDEGPYLKEWIEYHKLMGVEHFFLYNNLSEDDYLSELSDYIQRGEVDLIEWPVETSDAASFVKMQCDAYRDALERSNCKWLAIIDIDEFLVPAIENNLIDFLAKYEKDPKIGGVVFPWVFFGTSHIEKIPEGRLLIEMLTLNGGPVQGGNARAIWNSGNYKSIVRVKRVSELVSPHYCLYRKGVKHTLVSFDLGQINHYWTRDEAFLREVKIPRREKWGYSPETTRRWADGMNQTTEYGERIKRFIPLLKERLAYDE